MLLCSQHAASRSLRCTVYSTVSAPDGNNLWLAHCTQLFTGAACKDQTPGPPACLQSTPLFVSPPSPTDRPFGRAQGGGRSFSARQLGEIKGFTSQVFDSRCRAQTPDGGHERYPAEAACLRHQTHGAPRCASVLPFASTSVRSRSSKPKDIRNLWPGHDEQPEQFQSLKWIYFVNNLK